MSSRKAQAAEQPRELGARAHAAFDGLFRDNPELLECYEAVEKATLMLIDCVQAGGTIYTCGNGGSAADAEHIVGELVKSFKLERPLDGEFLEAYRRVNGEEPPAYLEGAIPAFSLVSQTSLATAFANDRDACGVFAQQVHAYGRMGDALIAISTSGNSANVVDAAKVARAHGMKVVALTGRPESALSALADAAIRVPDARTYRVQELHMRMYHAICAALEAEAFCRGPLHPDQPREAVVLAGGLGTRLADAVPDVPKPMAPVAGRPFLRYILDMLDENRFSHVVVADGHLREQIEAYFDGQYRGMRISYSSEDEPLGTGGAVRQALEYCSSDEVFVLNGDTFCEPDFDAMEGTFAHAGADVVMGVAEVRDSGRYGTVELGRGSVVSRFREKSRRKKGLVNAGVYLVDRQELIGYGSRFSLERDWLEPMARRGVVTAVRVGGEFIDIGVPEDYERAQELLAPLARSWKLAMFDRDGTVHVDTGHLHDPSELQLIDSTVELMRDYGARDGWKVVIVTNQAGIAKGLYGEWEMVEVNNRLQDMLQGRGTGIDAVYFCPHHPDFTGPCDCRKPAPGMLLRAMRDYDADPAECVMYGDKEKDMKAAEAAGVRGVLV